VVLNWVAMKDHSVWGEDAEDFKPERMLDGKFEALPVCRPLEVPLLFPASEKHL